MSDQPVIQGETVDSPTVDLTAIPKKRTFPTKSFVKYAVATTAAAILGGYVVKKVTDSADDEEDDGWTIEPVPTTPEPDPTN
jgi:hypothetical protein